ncbi:hypothetical protein GBAR_LOCUS16476, partial [Geodia barretti]
MLALGAISWYKRFIHSVVMVTPDALPRAFSIAVRRLESGISTGLSKGLSKSTLTPLLMSVGMWVLMEALLRRFPSTRTAFPGPNPVFATRGEMSDMELLLRISHVRLVACSSPVKSVMLALGASSSY